MRGIAGPGRSPGFHARRARALVGGVVRAAPRAVVRRSATCRSSGTRWCESPIRATSTWMSRESAGRARGVRERERRAWPRATAGPRSARPPTRSSCRRRTRWRARCTRPSARRRVRPDEPWLHQSLWHSIQVIFWGFLLSSLIGVPLGILCGAFPAFARLHRAVHRVLPLPAGAGVRRAGGRGARHLRRAEDRDHLHRHLLPAGAGRRQHHARIDPALLEAAQTLGANAPRCCSRAWSCPASSPISTPTCASCSAGRGRT